MKKLFFLYLLLCELCVFSQRNNDSLLKVFEEYPDTEAYVDSILVFSMTERRRDLSLTVASQKIAYEKAKKINSKQYVAKALLYMGSSYTNLGSYIEAAECLTNALRITEETGNKYLSMKVYVSLGNLYSVTDQHIKALEMYNKALPLAREKKDYVEESNIYNNIGGLKYVLSEMKPEKIRDALKYMRMSASLVEEQDKTSEVLINKYTNISLLYCDLLLHDSALMYLEKARVLMGDKPLPDNLITYYQYMGRIHADRKNYDSAEKYYFLSIDEARKLNNVDWVYESYLSLSDLYDSKKDYAKALDYFRKYNYLKDSVLNATNFEKVADIQNKFEREKKEAELNMLKAEQSRGKIINIAMIVVSVLLVISGIMMYSRFKIKSLSEKKLKQQNEIISQKNKDITDSINYSRKIQDAILPSAAALQSLFPRHFIFYRPKDIISGDFYWCAEKDEYKFFVVADCTGHGVPGALMSMLGTSLLKEIILTKRILETDKILNELRTLVIQALGNNTGNKDGMDIALIRYNSEKKELQFSGANNSVQLISEEIDLELKADKQPIGAFENMSDFKSQTVSVNKPVTVYLYTDGYADQFGGEKGKKFKYRQLDEMIKRNSALPVSKQKEELASVFEKWKGNLEQVDDVCVAGIVLGV